MEPLWMTFPWAGVPRRGVKMSLGMVDSETTTHMQHDMSSGGGTRQEGDRASLHTHCPFLLSPRHETLSAITMIIQPPGPELSFWGSRVVSCFAPNCQTYHMSCSHSFEMKIYTTHVKMQIHNTVAHYSRPTHIHSHTSTGSASWIQLRSETILGKICHVIADIGLPSRACHGCVCIKHIQTFFLVIIS